MQTTVKLGEKKRPLCHRPGGATPREFSGGVCHRETKNTRKGAASRLHGKGSGKLLREKSGAFILQSVFFPPPQQKTVGLQKIKIGLN